jgi:hypothetical protein
MAHICAARCWPAWRRWRLSHSTITRSDPRRPCAFAIHRARRHCGCPCPTERRAESNRRRASFGGRKRRPCARDAEPEYHLAAVAKRLADPADRNASFSKPAEGLARPLPPHITLVLETLCRGHECRIKGSRSTAMRTWRIDLSTAPRKQRLAFSMRCHR